LEGQWKEEAGQDVYEFLTHNAVQVVEDKKSHTGIFQFLEDGKLEIQLDGIPGAEGEFRYEYEQEGDQLALTPHPGGEKRVFWRMPEPSPKLKEWPADNERALTRTEKKLIGKWRGEDEEKTWEFEQFPDRTLHLVVWYEALRLEPAFHRGRLMAEVDVL